MNRLATIAVALLIALLLVGIVVGRDSETQPPHRVQLSESQTRAVMYCWEIQRDMRIENNGDGTISLACQFDDGGAE